MYFDCFSRIYYFIGLGTRISLMHSRAQVKSTNGLTNPVIRYMDKKCSEFRH